MKIKAMQSSTRQKIEKMRQRVFELSERLEEQIIFERINPEQREALDMMLRGYQRDYGPVSYQYWLRAVVRSMRKSITGLNQVLVHELLPRTASEKQKIKYLQVMAKQMGVDVIITRAVGPN